MVRVILNSTEVNAATNKFKKIFIGNSNDFSVHAQSALVITGVPTWTLKVCNFDGTQADFVPLAVETTNMAINSPVQCSECLFEYLAIEYTANSATGEIQFYFNND